MSSGERPIGAAKGKQSDTEALSPPPPPKGPPANSQASKVPAQGADGRQRRPIVHKEGALARRATFFTVPHRVTF